MIFHKHNAYKHIQPEIKVEGIFKHKLSIIFSLGSLLIGFFNGSCYMPTKYDFIGNQCEIMRTPNS